MWNDAVMPTEYLNKLLSVAPAPMFPKGCGLPVLWKRLEDELGITFPFDFKEIIAAYGYGEFNGFFSIANPFYSPANDIPYRDFLSYRLREMEAARSSYPEVAAPFPAFPSKGGLFPWGYTGNGDLVSWRTDGKSESWPIVCLDDDRSNEYDEFTLSPSEFLVKWLTGEISVPSLTPPDFFPLKEPVFQV